MTIQVALWLSLLTLLTVLTFYESLHDGLPDGVLSVACIGYAAALVLLAATPEQLVHGFAAGGAGFTLGLLGAPLAAPVGRRLLCGRAPLCVGLVVGWPGIVVVGVAWGFLASVVAFYFLITNRSRELLHVSYLPFLTLSAIIFFALRATVFR
ncbi:MAG TPA: hypothetical protein VK066_23070 [Chloroflexota bacterium]|nr:hypothetical protein [Chloroflexota bacterium]